jgi:hypothetical protein
MKHTHLLMGLKQATTGSSDGPGRQKLRAANKPMHAVGLDNFYERRSLIMLGMQASTLVGPPATG